MSKADVIEVEGTVLEKLPNAMFKVELEMCIRDRFQPDRSSPCCYDSLYQTWWSGLDQDFPR